MTPKEKAIELVAQKEKAIYKHVGHRIDDKIYRIIKEFAIQEMKN